MSAHVSTEVPHPGEEGLLATAAQAQALAEGLDDLIGRLGYFADWELLNVTETQAVALAPELTALRASLGGLTTRAANVLEEVDEWCARLVRDRPEGDEAFLLAMGRRSERGDPRWWALGAFWRDVRGDESEGVIPRSKAEINAAYRAVGDCVLIDGAPAEVPGRG